MDGKCISLDSQWKEYVGNLWVGIDKMTHAFISVFYINTLKAIGRNMSVVSEKLLCHFHVSKQTTKQRKPSQISKYILKCEIKLPSFWTCSFLKSNVRWRLSFDIGHTNHFSKQSLQTIPNLNNPPPVNWGSICIWLICVHHLMMTVYSWKI